MHFDRHTPRKLAHSDDVLRAELKKFGYNPGPIVDSTRSLYIKKLEEYKRGHKCNNVDRLNGKFKGLKVKDKPPQQQNTKKSYRIQIAKCLHNADWMENLMPFIKLEEEARQDFADPRKVWPGGYSKKSFTYLLLDPRVTKNLSARASRLNLNLQWSTFIDSIFYVGKGKSERPYKHLIEAKALWEKFKTSQDKKIQRILDIWENNMGVICLQVFHNLIPVEAFTYEAAMIDALGLKTLTNLKSGSYNGIVELWPFEEKRMLGVYLLYKAMRCYLNESERQLRPEDL